MSGPQSSATALSQDLARTVLKVLALLALTAGTLWVLWPFMAALLWASTIVIATWPLMGRVQSLLWQRRGLAVLAMTTALSLLFLVPLTAAVMTVVTHGDLMLRGLHHLLAWRPGALPAWVVQWPWLGPRLEHLWPELQTRGIEPWMARVSPYVGGIATGLLKELGALGAWAMQFLLTIPLAAVLYATGERLAHVLLRFAQRLAGPWGLVTARLAADSIRGVALGVVVTAVAQALLGGLGLVLAGIPAAWLLTALMFLLALAQIGVVPVLLPAAVWLLWADRTAWGVALLVWMLLVATLDNVLRPWLIQRDADLPWLLVFFGVVGGLMAFGLLGIFLGPVILAVTWTLLRAWIMDDPSVGDTRLPPTT